MYHFAIITLMALALVKVVDFLVDQMSGMQRMRSALVVAEMALGVVLLHSPNTERQARKLLDAGFRVER